MLERMYDRRRCARSRGANSFRHGRYDTCSYRRTQVSGSPDFIQRCLRAVRRDALIPFLQPVDEVPALLVHSLDGTQQANQAATGQGHIVVLQLAGICNRDFLESAEYRIDTIEACTIAPRKRGATLAVGIIIWQVELVRRDQEAAGRVHSRGKLIPIEIAAPLIAPVAWNG